MLPQCKHVNVVCSSQFDKDGKVIRYGVHEVFKDSKKSFRCLGCGEEWPKK